MTTMTKSWTDERLEERFDAIDNRFDGVDRRLDRVDADIRDLRQDMKAGFDRVDGRLDRMTESLEAMHRLIIQTGAVLGAALLGLIATQL